ncbi:MAG: diguanylate cyclase [Leptospiraceae bacterium]|nr:diguanylate cyclase [Leptospiraceae bacterium]MDW7975567.1 diguanylate cyclase [Leptospiraceae bacterium]
MTFFKSEYALVELDEELVKKILYHVDIPFVVFDQELKILYANERFYLILKFEPNEIIGTKIDINSRHIKDDFYFFLLNARFKSSQRDYTIQTPLNITPFELKNQIYYLGTIHNAYYDTLTGFPNVSIFKLNLEKAIANAKRKNHVLAVLFIDVNNFKFINDNFGHYIGDKLIQKIASILESSLRHGDFITRKGGDEFLMLLNELSSKEEAVLIVQDMLRILDSPVIVENQEISVSLSIGISFYPYDGEQAQELIQKADYVMYRVKEKKQNSFALFTNELEKEMQLRNQIEKEFLNDYYDNFKNFGVVYQPIFRYLSKNKFYLDSFEVFFRWNRRTQNEFDTKTALEVAKQKGFLFEIEKFVFLNVLETFKQIGKLTIPIHFNISDRMFYDANFISFIIEKITEYQISHEFFVLEISETTLYKNTSYSLNILSVLKEKGFVICVDDFMSSQTDVKLLFKTKPDFLKINIQSFLSLNDDFEFLLEIIDSVSMVLKPKIIVSKIETKEVLLRLLQSKRFQFFQGFYLGKILNSSQVFDYLKKRSRL